MKFEELGLAETLLRAVRGEGYSTPTKIQAAAIPPILEGRDVLGCAQTGTGKTAAFALPTLQRLGRSPARAADGENPCPGPGAHPRAGDPDRREFSGIRPSYRSAVHRGLRRRRPTSAGPRLAGRRRCAIATPGRLLDLMQQGFIDLSHVEILILDEADRMLDMGFIHDLRRIVAKVPARRQTLLFSATMPPAIRQLANQWLTNPSMSRSIPRPGRSTPFGNRWSLSIKPTRSACSRIGCITPLGRGRWSSPAPSIGPTRWPSFAKGGIEADAFHADKSQSSRQRILARFKSPDPVVLIATDIAARGWTSTWSRT